MTEAVETQKRVDESFKAQVEADRAALEAEKPKTLKEVLSEAQFNEEEGLPLQAHTKILVVTYDPATRDVAVNKVTNISGMYDMISVLRDAVYQLEQMELSRKAATMTTVMVDGQMRKYQAANAVRGRH